MKVNVLKKISTVADPIKVESDVDDAYDNVLKVMSQLEKAFKMFIKECEPHKEDPDHNISCKENLEEILEEIKVLKQYCDTTGRKQLKVLEKEI